MPRPLPRVRLLLAPLLAAGWWLTLATGPAPRAVAQGAQANVGVYDNMFIPREVVVPVGGTVVWTNLQSLHNVVGDRQLWDSGLLVRPATFQRVFDQPGQYRYQCTLHSGMTGTVLVLAPGAAPPPAPSAARAGTPRLRFVEPSEGATLAADQVRVRVQIDDFRLDPRGLTSADADGGHWHLLVDGARLQVLVGEDAVLPPLAPGPHTLEAQLRRHDHSRVEGAVPARVAVTVLPAAGTRAPAAPRSLVPLLLAGLAAVLFVAGTALANRPPPRQLTPAESQPSPPR